MEMYRMINLELNRCDAIILLHTISSYIQKTILVSFSDEGILKIREISQQMTVDKHLEADL